MNRTKKKICLNDFKFEDNKLIPQKILKTALSICYGHKNSYNFIQELKRSGVEIQKFQSKYFTLEETKEIFDKMGEISKEYFIEKFTEIENFYKNLRKRTKLKKK